MPGDDALRARRRQRLENRIDNGHWNCHPRAHGGGLGGAHHPTWGKHNFDRPQRAVVNRQQKRSSETLESDLHGGAAGGGPGVKKSGDLRRDTAQIDGHLVALHFDADFDWDVLADIDASSSMNDSASYTPSGISRTAARASRSLCSKTSATLSF